jgi:hypothetical protein
MMVNLNRFYALLFISFLTLLPSSEAATIVGGMITTDTVWTEANRGPHRALH